MDRSGLVIIFEKEPVVGRFIQRKNRFIAEVEIENETHDVHVPNTGRMLELLRKGAKVILKYHPAPHKKTEHTLICVEKEGILVCIDSRSANDIYFDFLKNGYEEELLPIDGLKREVKYLNSRFDIGLITNGQQMLIEIKSVNLVEDSHAMFPDAPTIRGNRHIRELIEAQSVGLKAGIVFIIQRPDASTFSPHWGMDPAFSESLLLAKKNGLFIKAYNCCVDQRIIEIKKEVQINL